MSKRYVATIQVSLKPTVNDPEGNTIAGALGNLGFEGVASVRAGRFFRVEVDASGKKKAAKQVEEMCARLLANPVIETYDYKLRAADQGTTHRWFPVVAVRGYSARLLANLPLCAGSGENE